MPRGSRTQRGRVLLQARVIDASGRERFSRPTTSSGCSQSRTGRWSQADHGRGLMHGDFIMCPTVCYRKSRRPSGSMPTTWSWTWTLPHPSRRRHGSGCRLSLMPIVGTRRTRQPVPGPVALEEESQLRPGGRRGSRPRLAGRGPRHGPEADHQDAPDVPDSPGSHALATIRGPTEMQFSVQALSWTGE